MIDIVIPIYNEGEVIYSNVKVVSDVLNSFEIPHHFILVDDGSKDKTALEIARLKNDLGNVTGLIFSRNFGKEAALCAGVAESSAEYCVTMDSDLQHPPEVIPLMLEKIKEGYDIVEAVKSDRGRESLFYRIAAKGFYGMLRSLSGFDMDNSSDFKLLGKRVINAFKEVGDRKPFFRGMIEWVGFSKATVPFAVAERAGGETKFSTFKLLKMAVSAITAYSSAPLMITNLLSAGFALGALLLGVQTLMNFFSGHAASGFSTVILLLLILGAAVLFSLGIIGTYLSKIYDEVKERPRYIVKEKL